MKMHDAYNHWLFHGLCKIFCALRVVLFLYDSKIIRELPSFLTLHSFNHLLFPATSHMYFGWNFKANRTAHQKKPVIALLGLHSIPLSLPTLPSFLPPPIFSALIPSISCCLCCSCRRLLWPTLLIVPSQDQTRRSVLWEATCSVFSRALSVRRAPKLTVRVNATFSVRNRQPVMSLIKPTIYPGELDSATKQNPTGPMFSQLLRRQGCTVETPSSRQLLANMYKRIA